MEIIVDLCNQHFGSLSELKRMSLNAYLAGADVVKIQLMDSESVFGDNSRKYRDVTYENFKNLNEFCKNLDIPLMATAFNEESLDWITSLNIERFKIASKTVKSDPKLCEKILRLNKNTIISTGFCKPNEFPFGHDKNISYLFCVSKYPTFLYDDDLKKMPSKFDDYKGYAGYSDHTIGIAACIEAYNRGSKIIEKHFSNNPIAQSKFEGGHLGAFDKDSLSNFRKLIRELDIIRG